MPQAFFRIAGTRPLGGAAMPAHRLREIGGLFPVMRQQRRLLVEVAGVRRLDDARDGRVQPPAPLLELRGERHFLRQRMLEEILGDRIERLLVDELGVLELLQRFAQLRRVLLDDCRERRLVELPADDRGGLQHVLLPCRQPVDARRKQRMHRARHLQLADRRDQT